ncbi:recombinase family protein, partial [Escherichia coli]
MSRIFAYCRISTLDQTTENQRREIESAGFKIKPQQIIEEHISGSALMNPLMILVKIIKLRWIHILSYDQMV